MGLHAIVVLCACDGNGNSSSVFLQQIFRFIVFSLFSLYVSSAVESGRIKRLKY